MPMLPWSTYRSQISKGVEELGKLSPETVRGYVALSSAGQTTGHLDEKTVS